MNVQIVSKEIRDLIDLEFDVERFSKFESTRQYQVIRDYLKLYHRLSLRFAKNKNLQLKLKLVEPSLADFYAGKGRQSYIVYYKWLNG